MKAKVLRKFIDKNTNKEHGKGSVIDVTEKRFEELFDLGFVSFSEDETVKKSPAKVQGKKNVKLETLKEK